MDKSKGLVKLSVLQVMNNMVIFEEHFINVVKNLNNLSLTKIKSEQKAVPSI